MWFITYQAGDAVRRVLVHGKDAIEAARRAAQTNQCVAHVRHTDHPNQDVVDVRPDGRMVYPQR
jgi:hypothetical protein